jgi:hypothetical protein
LTLPPVLPSTEGERRKVKMCISQFNCWPELATDTTARHCMVTPVVHPLEADIADWSFVLGGLHNLFQICFSRNITLNFL